MLSKEVLIIFYTFMCLFLCINSDGLVSIDEFDNAVVSNGYPKPNPTDKQYDNFISRTPDGEIETKRELAMFLAQIMWESAGLTTVIEECALVNGCDDAYADPDNDYPDKKYYGRGYIQLSWWYNYKAASSDLFNDDRLYTDPDQVATNDDIAWAVSFWFWKTNVHSLPGVSDGEFGVTTKAINGALECSGSNYDTAKKRFEIYKIVLTAFNIDEEANENGCYQVSSKSIE